jgi:hypothetical protein
MFDDLHQQYLEWSRTTGLTSIGEFSDYVFEQTGVMLSDILTDAERQQLMEMLQEEGIFEGMDSGP